MTQITTAPFTMYQVKMDDLTEVAMYKAADVEAVLKEARWAAGFILTRYRQMNDEEKWGTTQALYTKQRAQRLLETLPHA